MSSILHNSMTFLPSWCTSRQEFVWGSLHPVCLLPTHSMLPVRYICKSISRHAGLECAFSMCIMLHIKSPFILNTNTRSVITCTTVRGHVDILYIVSLVMRVHWGSSQLAGAVVCERMAIMFSFLLHAALPVVHRRSQGFAERGHIRIKVYRWYRKPHTQAHFLLTA